MRHGRHLAPGSRRPDELERREADEARTAPRAADDVLALQRSAGNKAVSALLARSPDTAKPKQDDKSAATEGARATLPGIGTIPLLSVSFGGGRAPTAGATGPGEARTPQEIVFSSKAGEHSPMLFKAAHDGKPMDVDVIMPSGKSTRRLKLSKAIVSSYG